MFKVGDWVASKHTGEVCLCKKIDGYEFYSNESKWHIITSYSIWHPKEGELVCRNFSTNSFLVGRYGTEGFIENVEPFIGELPSFLKENR